ncbi:MAG: glycoside hydrolase 43 family protein [Melioribacteraceae bacterium]|nr:glycoside hydrolase 43 family protein [Melioribacteraceae bacterium]
MRIEYSQTKFNADKKFFVLFILLLTTNLLSTIIFAQNELAKNPIIYADVPDMSIIRVGENYYMSSTTMHMSPGVPIMKSTDLINWEIVNYVYDILDNVDELNLVNGKFTYGRGSWASCLRYHNGTYYISTFSQTTNKTYIYKSKDIEKGSWQKISFSPSYHDNTLFFDNDKAYLIWGSGKLMMVQLKFDLSGVIEGTERVLIENATQPSGPNVMLPAEGSQIIKVNGKYYLFNISWPRGGMRTVIIHRADKITGPYEGRVGLQDDGIAQGGLIDTPDGEWYAYLFQDHGSVGRIPFLVPVTWEYGWPVLGTDGRVPTQLNLPVSKGLIPGIVDSDEFEYSSSNELKKVWQWNHNPDNNLWSVNEREGYLRLITGRIDSNILLARNTLTQRTIGPQCTGIIKLDISNMKTGDYAGLLLLQKKYGSVGISYTTQGKSIQMVNAESDTAKIIESFGINQNVVYFKIECDFKDRIDEAKFYYSFNCEDWKSIGNTLHMQYTLPHFMGYRFGLFNYATQISGGYIDFDYFHIYNN